MISNFYENLIPEKDKENRELIKKMSNLIDESLDSFILLRQRQSKDKVNIQIKPSKKISFEIRDEPRYIGDEISSLFYSRNRNERLERIRRMDEETENLERLIENDNIETIG